MDSDYSLLRGDCLNKMGFLDEGSVDMVLVDLPYGTTACEWDAVIPL
jgi:site-specific DNA-methyltransferase (adenine-specific)